jgi:beta-glucosidase
MSGSANGANGFPRDFRFGVATAAFQIEGAAGRGTTIWDSFCRVPGAIDGGDTGDIACDHYHRWKADVDLMASLHVESYRFSIAWARVLPDGRTPSREGLDFYRRLIERLLEHGIEPIATLYHWDLPQVLQDAGGWAVRDTCERFAEYAALLADEFGDLVDQWITQNEPLVAAFLGHAEGIKAPGQRDWPTALRVSHHLLLSHARAREAIKSITPAAQVGVALNLDPVHAATAHAADLAAARRGDGYLNRWFLDPLLRGAYPDDMLALYDEHFGPFDAVEDGDLAAICEPLDFLGVNYYRPNTVRYAPGCGPLELTQVQREGEQTAMGWRVDPSGLREMLARLRNDYGPMPIYITENGAAFDDPAPNGEPWVDDPRRTAYLQGHIEAMRQAIAEGADVRRYCVWSLLDNFEWEHGYSKRFGIVHVNFQTQRRLPKSSGLWYRDYIDAVRGDGG